MILIDANLLLYAYDSRSPRQKVAEAWLEAVFSSGQPVGLAWQTILAFLRIGTHAGILTEPMPVSEAASIVSGWLVQRPVSLLHPTERHWDILSRLLTGGQASGPLVMDAHLAALAIEHGAVLCSTDRDFTRFKGLRLLNPLEQDSRPEMRR
jgi:uncharacterized protein